jgi:predicted TIM-barrel fold metal-dependent hydrolase
MKPDEQDKASFPIPMKINGTDEYGPCPQTREQELVEARLLELSGSLAAKLGMTRRSFLRSASGMVAAFLAMNSVFGHLFSVEPAEAMAPDLAEEMSSSLKAQFIFDVQTHFVSNDYTGRGLLSLRRLAAEWNPAIRGDEDLGSIRYRNFVKEVFEQSDTKLALLSNAPADDPSQWFLSNNEAIRARKEFNERAGAKRLFAHAVFTPGMPGWMEELDRAIEELKPDSWKGYTVGSPSTLSKYPWRLDDEKLVYPAYEKMQKAGIRHICIHKGLLPRDYGTRQGSTWRYGGVDDVPQAAKDWPNLNFMIYHSAIRNGGLPAEEDVKSFDQKGYIPWISELSAMPEKHGVKNVYAELGSVFALTAVSSPRFCAGILGTLIKGLGADHVLWGTDSVWYGSPQWQIEAFRRIEIPADLQERFGFSALGPADGAVRNMIFGRNAAGLYGVKAA